MARILKQSSRENQGALTKHRGASSALAITREREKSQESYCAGVVVNCCVKISHSVLSSDVVCMCVFERVAGKRFFRG